ncbi:hypothetical protein DFH09DRAFT_1183995 [Mycena vulgaris]|nr:hypothetical protein DFH09DRAFT_1183995 [Mycena vulgaris]
MQLFPHRVPRDTLSPLSVIISSLNSMASRAQLDGVPYYVQPIILLASAIVHTIQQLKENKRAFKQLANDTYAMVQAIRSVLQDGPILSDEVKRSIKDFTDVLKGIQTFVRQHRVRGTWHRVFAVADDASKIHDCGKQIRLALDIFEMQMMQMRIHQNTARTPGERAERRASLPPPYSSEDVGGMYSDIPEEVSRIVHKDSYRFLPILGVFSVFQEPPTIGQIARVLEIAEGEVQEVWGPVSSYIDGLDADGKTRCLGCLERLVYSTDGSLSIDSPTYHNLVARWCLEGSKLCASDVFYASDFWVHHVCHSKPSLELRDALTNSQIPLESELADDLAQTINWLERIDDEEGQWSNLLLAYREKHRELLAMDVDGPI